MKNIKLLPFLSLAVVTLTGAGCTSSSAPETSNTSTADTNTQAAADTQTSPPADTSESNTPSTNTDTAPVTENASLYADGTYSATGTYTSPGGKESLPVTLTLEGGVIVEVSVETPATNPASQKWQTVFAQNFQALVVGKNIDDLELTNVSGSSLTPKGFNDAVAQIKAEAQS